MISQLFPLHFIAMSLPPCQTVRDLFTGIPTLRLPQRKMVSLTIKWDKPIRFWSRGTASSSTKMCSTESDSCPAQSRITFRSLFFSATVVAPENSSVYQKYIQPILACNSLPFVVFRHDSSLWKEVHRWIRATYHAIREHSDCYELEVQRNISCILEAVFRNFDSLPKSEASRIQMNAQIRLQKMLSYIYKNYDQTVTLTDIADAANISRSEAGRCFQSFLGCSPVEALIQYRLQTAQRLLRETTLTLQEISFACGFHSVNYFSRQFRKRYGYSPGKKRQRK